MDFEKNPQVTCQFFTFGHQKVRDNPEKYSFQVGFSKIGQIINFDTTLMGRNDVKKNKWTPYFLTEFHGESENKGAVVAQWVYDHGSI